MMRDQFFNIELKVNGPLATGISVFSPPRSGHTSYPTDRGLHWGWNSRPRHRRTFARRI